MGRIVAGKCNHCGYRGSVYFGTGSLLPMQYEEITQKMKEGLYGDFSQKFFIEHPDGAVDCSTIVLLCRNCKMLYNDKDLTMYVPKENYKLEPSETSCFVHATKYDLVKHYIEYAKYNHICPKCASQVNVLSFEDVQDMFENHEIKCHKCGKKMDFDGVGRYD